MNNFKKSLCKLTYDSIVNIARWCESNNALLGVCGSSIGGTFASPNDLDLLIVLNSKRITRKTFYNNPLGHIDLSFWDYFVRNYKEKKIDIFATHYGQDSNIHIEIYPIEIFQKILLLTDFTVRRIRKGPLSSKDIILYSTAGGKITQKISPSKTLSNGLYSEVKNIARYGDCVYLGIHIEKLLVCNYIYSRSEEIGSSSRIKRT